MVLDDRRLKVYKIVKVVSISDERVRHILHEELSMRKLCVRWMPHLCALAIGKLRDLKYKLLEHLPYTSDLVPSDFHLFSNLKKFVVEKRLVQMKR